MKEIWEMDDIERKDYETSVFMTRALLIICIVFLGIIVLMVYS